MRDKEHSPTAEPADLPGRLPTAGQILRGTDEVPAKPVAVWAGSLSAEFVAGELRHLRVGDVEIVRRIVVAVRDQAWNTLPPALADVRIRQDGEAFEIGLTSRHEMGDLCFAWEGLIRGAADGSCSFSMAGRAVTSFPYRRIGICVLLPPGEVAGRRCMASLAGRQFAAELPLMVAPPGPSAGVDVPLVPAFDRLSIAGRQMTTDLIFTGDQFEIEDQRNWTDDSFKAYSRFPPVGEAPEQMIAGTQLRQSVSVSVTARVRPRGPKPRQAAHLMVGDLTSARMPDVGLAHADQSPPPTADSACLLRGLAPSHLRVDLHLGSDGWPDRLADAGRQAEAVGCPLEVAVFLPAAAAADFGRLNAALTTTDLRRVLVYRADAESTPAADLAMMRNVLAPLPSGTPIAGGTDLYFAQLNRTRPDVEAMDAVVFPITPQVHAADEESIIESADGVRAVVRTAHDFCAGRPVLVSPISLRPRYNPDAADEPSSSGHGLPDSVDARQMSVFGACWGLVTLKALAEEGVSATTWLETTGPRGVIENAAPRSFLGGFPSRPDLVFPLYHVLRDACELRGAPLLGCSCNQPLQCAAMAVRKGGRVTILVANLRPEPATAQVLLARTGLVTDVAVRRLNTETATAMLAAESYRRQAQLHRPRANLLSLNLLPYEYTRLDYKSA
ncbi:MAG TPA: hypothetical protein VFQ44_03750 [Streptosporangiaceae bacterium]|nr:hypothetical protein [Streptosporangiaceae bacterium]